MNQDEVARNDGPPADVGGDGFAFSLMQTIREYERRVLVERLARGRRRKAEARKQENTPTE